MKKPWAIELSAVNAWVCPDILGTRINPPDDIYIRGFLCSNFHLASESGCIENTENVMARSRPGPEAKVAVAISQLAV